MTMNYLKSEPIKTWVNSICPLLEYMPRCTTPRMDPSYPCFPRLKVPTPILWLEKELMMDLSISQLNLLLEMDLIGELDEIEG